MRIGFDVDGVLADFNTTFIERVVKVTGRDLFPARPFDITTWNYPEFYGYSKEETSKVWGDITADPTFWLNLAPYWDAMTVLEQVRPMTLDHDLYFITSRPGILAKQQTEVWLATHADDVLWNPTVLISSNKGACAKALRLDVYIDDRWENVVDVAEETKPDQMKPIGPKNWPATATYLLDQPWNRKYRFEDIFGVTRVPAVGCMLDRLALVEPKAA